jgi:hypothetical protein
LKSAQESYQKVKHALIDQGDAVMAGHFFYREQECARRIAAGGEKLKQTLQWLLWGYGERPSRILLCGLAVILAFSLVYLASGDPHFGSFFECLYYSAVSFTALGYGNWAATPSTWLVKYLGVMETGFGVMLVALLVVSLARKMSRL